MVVMVTRTLLQPSRCNH